MMQNNTPSEELYAAVSARQWNKAQALLAGGAAPDARTLNYVVINELSKDWMIPLIKAGGIPTTDMLYTAVARRQGGMAGALLDGGAVPDARTLNYVVVNELSKDWMIPLINAGGKPTTDMLYTAVARRQGGMAGALVDGGAVPDERTLSYVVVNELSVDWMKLLLRAGGKPTTDMLYTAVARRQGGMAGALVDGGAVPDGRTLSYVVVNELSVDWMKLLLRAGGKPTTDMLYTAVARRQGGMASALVDGGAVPDQKTLTYVDVNRLDKSWADLLSKAVKDGRRRAAEARTEAYNAVASKPPPDDVQATVKQMRQAIAKTAARPGTGGLRP